jgi:hypothetical protein
MKYFYRNNNNNKYNGENNRSIVCSKCFFLNNLDDYRNFLWWLQLNKQIGYEKISFCDNSLDLDYFKMNKYAFFNFNFLQIEQFKCIPNFIKKSQNEYFNHLTDLNYNGVFSYATTDIFNVIFTNDCFLKNSNQNDYLAVLDNDETVIPRVSRNYKTLDDYRKFLLEIRNFDYKEINYESLAKTIDKIECDHSSNVL